METVIKKLKGVTGYAKNQHASSVVVGFALAGYAMGLYFGLSREVLIMSAAAIVLILVPIANAIHE
jgi:hypothetical protein